MVYTVYTMLLNFFKKKKTITLILDIGSASVGAALVRIEEGKPPHILLTIRENIPLQGILSSVRFVAGANHALTQIFKKIQANKKDYIIPSRIFCTLSSPWFLLKIRHARVVMDNQFEVTEELMNSLLNEEIEHLKEELKETLPLKDIEIIEKKIIQIKLNGYQIENPYGKKTSSVDIVATISLSSHRALENIRNIVNNFFHTTDFHIGVFPLTTFSAIRDMYPYRQDFIAVDIAGEATDISLVNDDILAGTAFFSYGRNYFIREISVGQKTSQEEAETLFGMYLREEIEERKYIQIKNIIEQSRAEWIANFRKTIASLVGDGRPGHMVFYTADTDVSSFFGNLIKEVFAELSRQKEIEIEYIDAKAMANFVSFESGIVRDPFLAIEALFLEKISTDLSYLA